jgi:hypothetical protein
LTQLESAHQELQAAGLQTIAIGLGQPKHARNLCGRLAPSLTCYVDDGTNIYKQYGLEQSTLGQLLSPSMAVASARALSKGHVNGEVTGDVKMLPGTFLVDVHGRVQWLYYSTHPGDHPKIADILNAAQAVSKV